MHEAQFYENFKEDIVKCTLCPHYCLIQEGKVGVCAVRKNVRGKLYSLVYEKSIASHIDPVEKKPLFHFLPGSRIFSFATAGCNMRCSFCQNWDISQISKGKEGRIKGDELSAKTIVELAKKYRCESIAMTYNEPTIFFEYAYDVCKIAKKEGIKTVFVSNGYITKPAIKKISKYLDAINIDLKSFNPEFYKNICGAKLDSILESIKEYHKNNVWVEITTLIVPGENDSDEELKDIASFVASIDKTIPWHISRFVPHYKMTEKVQTPFSTLKKAYDIGKDAGLHYVYIGNVPINEYEDTRCPKCNKIIIGRLGFDIHRLHMKGNLCSYCHHKIEGVF